MIQEVFFQREVNLKLFTYTKHRSPDDESTLILKPQGPCIIIDRVQTLKT